MYPKKLSIMFLASGLVFGLIIGYSLAPRVDTTSLQQLITDLQGQVSVLNNTLSESNAQIVNLKAELAEKNHSLTELQGKLNAKDGQILDLEAEVMEKDALISTLQEDLNELKRLVPPYKMSNIDPANFVEGVNNRYFPLTPGTKLLYEGESEDGKVRTEDYVTFETKQILGVTCIVVNNRVTLDGELIEETFDWYAQDKDGNVWYFGEDSKEYEGGVVISTAGSWEAGVDGALPGIIMEADPKEGDLYRQEYLKGEAEDLAEVLKLNESISIAHGSYNDLLITREWTMLEPGVVELKYYAPGVGLILEVMVEGGSERVELVEIIVTEP